MTTFRIPRCLFAVCSLVFLLHSAADLDAQSKERTNRVRRELDREIQGKPAGLQDPRPRRQDPIQKLIADLETGDYKDFGTAAKQAYNELSRLGVLVLPLIHKRLLDLNPFGIRAALELAVEYPTPELYRNLELMLEDRDLSKQILAAQVLFRLPPDKVRRHVELASKSSHPVVRLGALHAQVTAGADVKPILGEIKPLLRRREKDVHNAAVIVLGAIQDPDVKKILEELLVTWDGESWAAAQWVQRTDQSEEAAALALYERLENPVARAFLLRYVIEDRPTWLRLQARGMELLTVPAARVWLADTSVATGFERLSNAGTGPAPSKDTLKKLLTASISLDRRRTADLLLVRPHEPEWADLIEHILFMDGLDYDYRQRALRWLKATAPLRLLARSEELLDAFADVGALLAERGDVSHVLLAVRWFRKHPKARHPSLEYLIREKSDRTTLPLLIRFARLPCANSFEAQKAANDALDRWFDRHDIPVALDALQDVNGTFGYAILENVARVATRDDVPKVVKAMRIALDRVRYWEKSLGASTDAVLPPSTVVASTILLLGKLGGQDAADALKPLLGHGLTDVRELSTDALLKMAGTDRKKVVRELLTAADTTYSLPKIMFNPLARTDKEVQELVEKCLIKLPLNSAGIDTYVYFVSLSLEDRRAMALRILAGQKDLPMVNHDPAISALRVLGDQQDVVEFIPQFAQWLPHPDSNVRYWVVEQLGRTYSPRAVPYLLQALKDENQRVRTKTTEILERFETYRSQVERFRKLTTIEWPEPGKEEPRKKGR